MNTAILPTVNVTLNALAGILLLFGWFKIKQKKPDQHKRLMILAFSCSVLFLCSYLLYHFLHPGVTRYPHTGISRFIYLTILGTHTPLAAVVPFLAIAAIYHAVKGNLQTHVRITRWLFPLWMYVSVTGVVVYLMLYIF